MAWPNTLPGLTLLLPLLLPLWAPTTAGVKKVVLLSPREVNGSLDGNIILPCVLLPRESETPQVTLIRWMRKDFLGATKIIAEFHRELGSNIQEHHRMEFKAAKLGADLLDASLIIHRLGPSDDANYTCEVHIAPFHTGSAHTKLHVFFAPKAFISLYNEIGPGGHRDISLYCHVMSNPEPKTYDWSTTTGPLPNYVVPQRSQLVIQPTEEPISTTFICRVYNDVGMGQAFYKLQLPGFPREPSSSDSHSALRIGLIVSGIMFVAALGVLVFSLRQRQSSLDLHGTGANGAISDVSVMRENHAFQDPPTEGARGQTDQPGDSWTGGDVKPVSPQDKACPKAISCSHPAPTHL